MSLVIFDTETAGLTDRHPTIQIAAIAVDNDWVEIAAFERKLQFTLQDADEKALAMNSYDHETWFHEAVDSRVALSGFCEFLRDHADLTKVSQSGKKYTVARLCGHNAAAFDLPRVSGECRNHSLFFPGDFAVLDSLQLYRWSRFINPHAEGPESGKLGDIAKFYGIDTDGAHDALADCRIVAAIVPKLLATVGAKEC